MLFPIAVGMFAIVKTRKPMKNSVNFRHNSSLSPTVDMLLYGSVFLSLY